MAASAPKHETSSFDTMKGWIARPSNEVHGKATASWRPLRPFDYRRENYRRLANPLREGANGTLSFKGCRTCPTLAGGKPLLILFGCRDWTVSWKVPQSFAQTVAALTFDRARLAPRSHAVFQERNEDIANSTETETFGLSRACRCFTDMRNRPGGGKARHALLRRGQPTRRRPATHRNTRSVARSGPVSFARDAGRAVG